MTWFLRKSLRLGRLRLNLSKRGVGASVGVTGARIGVDATGKPYAAGGRHGLYFRARLGGAQGAPPGPRPNSGAWWWVVVVALVVGVVVGILLAGRA